LFDWLKNFGKKYSPQGKGTSNKPGASWVDDFLKDHPEFEGAREFLDGYHQMCVEIRKEIAAILNARYPSVEMVGEKDGNFIVRKDGVEHLWELDGIYSAVALLPAAMKNQKRIEIYLNSASKLLGNPIPESFSLAGHGQKIWPMLLNPKFFKDLNLPHSPVPSLGLITIYCIHQHLGLNLNPPVGDELLKALGVSTQELHELALNNLLLDFPPQVREAVTKATDGGEAAFLQRGDGFDAARLLIIPKLLQGEQFLLSLILHRDMLLLLPGSLRNDRNKLSQAVQAIDCADHPPLLDQPVIVRQSGFELLSLNQP
jgi:hypothetical protein